MQTLLDEILQPQQELFSNRRTKPRRPRPRKPIRFKSGSANAVPVDPNKPRVVFVPGMMGSKLALKLSGGEIDMIWPPSIKEMDGPKLQVLITEGNGYDHGGKMTAVGPFNFLNIYKDILNKLQLETDLLAFSYDWRLSNSASAKKLREAMLTKWPDLATPGNGVQRVTIIAHSLGGLTARYFIEALQGHQWVHQLIGVGLPNLGSPSALLGVKNLLRPAKKISLGSFASLMELLPVYDFAYDQQGNLQTYSQTYKMVDQELKKGKITTALRKIMNQNGWDTNSLIQKFRAGLSKDPDQLNSWLQSNNLEYHFVASTGLETKKGYNLSTKKKLLNYTGDGTVQVHSALWSSNSENQSHIKRRVFNGIVHMKMFKSELVQNYCVQQVRAKSVK